MNKISTLQKMSKLILVCMCPKKIWEPRYPGVITSWHQEVSGSKCLAPKRQRLNTLVLKFFGTKTSGLKGTPKSWCENVGAKTS